MAINKLINKYKKIPIEVKASIWFVICSILQRGISLITVPIFTRLMNSEQYGVYNNYLSWYNIIIVFTSLNLYYGVFNNAMVKFESQRDKYIASMQGLTTTVTLIFLLVYLPFRNTFNVLLDMETPLVLLLFVELLVTPFLQFWTVHNRFDYKYRSIVIVTLLKSALNPLLGVLLVLHSEQKGIARIISVVLVEVCICGYIGVYQYYKGKIYYNKKFWKYAILFNLPLLPHYLSGSILNQGDRIMIRKIAGLSEVAFYSVAYNIGILMNMFTSAINSSFTPWIYKELKSNRTKNIARIVDYLLILMAGLVSLVMLVAPEIMMIIAPEEYKEAVYVIPPVAASVYFTFMYNIMSNVEFYYEERKYVSIGSIVAATCNLILNAFFIPLFGYVAAGYTTMLCYAIYGLSHLLFSRLVIRKNIGLKNVFDEKGVLLITSAVVTVTILNNFLYINNIARYILILIIGTGIVIERKKIKGIICLVRSK